MSFLTPFMLWGALAAGVPIAIHLFFRSRYRTVPWAAMKFLLTSIEQTSRRLKFQELLLLAVRCLLLILLALAFARPISSVLRGTGRGDAVDAVLVFDLSMSMGAQDGTKTRIERAKIEAQKIIDELPPHSTVQIVTCAGGREELLGPRSPANLDQAKYLVGELEANSLATNLTPGITRAGEILSIGQAANKELYVFSDMQKQGWERQSNELVQTLQEMKDKTSVHLVRCGTRTIKNVSIVGITPQAGVPRPGQRVGFSVLVRNNSSESVQNLEVALSAEGDDKNQEKQALDSLPPGETRTVTLTAKFEKAGLRTLTATLKHDDLEGDNRLDQVILVRDYVHILVIDGDYSKEKPGKSSSYNLALGLLPARETEWSTFYFQPHVITPRLASPAQLQRYDLCVLANVSLQAKLGSSAEALPADFVEALGKYVRAGHGLVIYAGDNVNPESYNQLLGEKQNLLPATLGKSVKFPAEKPARLNRNSFEPPAFLPFKDDERYKEFGEIGIWQYLDTTEIASPKKADDKKDDKDKKEENAVSVILRYSDGKPAVLSRKVDAGEVVLFTTAANLQLDDKFNVQWSDWPASWVFVPFLHTTVNHLLFGQTQTYNVVAGQTLNWHPTEKTPHTYTLIHPGGRSERLGEPSKAGGNRLVVAATDLPRAGIYRMVARPARNPGSDADDAPATKAAGVPIAVAPDLSESADLEAFTDPQLDERLGFAPFHRVAGADEGAGSGLDRLNREWTLWAMLAVLAVLMFEGTLAWWCSRAW
jgi:hypothetical protein